MNRLSTLLKKRLALVAALSKYPLALAGNLSKSRVPPQTGKYFWRLTWKEKQKTKIQYVRHVDLIQIQQGVRQFVTLRKVLLQLGEVNRAVILLQRISDRGSVQ